ncbi:flagellar protein FlgN [Natronospora cellulosivora (SeqCode)]
MSESSYKALLEVLKEEEKLYSKLLELANEKKEAIVANDIDNLSKLLQDDNEIISLLNQLDQERFELIKSICENKGVEKQDPSFKELIKLIPEPWQEPLSASRNKLLALIDELHEQNEQNKFLINEAIKLNNASVNMFLKAVEPENTTYNNKQKSVDNKSAHIIDRRG